MDGYVIGKLRDEGEIEAEYADSTHVGNHEILSRVSRPRCQRGKLRGSVLTK